MHTRVGRCQVSGKRRVNFGVYGCIAVRSLRVLSYRRTKGFGSARVLFGGNSD